MSDADGKPTQRGQYNRERMFAAQDAKRITAVQRITRTCGGCGHEWTGDAGPQGARCPRCNA